MDDFVALIVESSTLSQEKQDEIRNKLENFEPVDLGSGNDDLEFVYLTAAPDAFVAIDAGSGNDSINGFLDFGRLEIDGGSGDDTIDAFADVVRLSGGSGDDTIQVEGNDVVAHGGSGADLIVHVRSGLFPDARSTLYGNAGNDTLYADEGDGVMIGGSGDDEMAGLDGNDIMTGGSGRDRFDSPYGFAVVEEGIFTLGDDTATDYRAGQDVIRFLTVTEDQFDYFRAQVTISQIGDDTLIDWGADPDGNEIGTLTLLGITDFAVEDIVYFAFFDEA